MATNSYSVYLLSSLSRVLYVGVTNDLHRRVSEHKAGHIHGFTSKYHVNRLVYFEEFDSVNEAIGREKQFKGWSRAKKVALIEKENPDWEDLSVRWRARSVTMAYPLDSGIEGPSGR